MARTTVSTAFSNASDPLFREWTQAIESILTNGGWSLVADSGDADLTTITAPVAVNTAQGYQIWKTNDGLTDLYMKIEYGSGATSATRPAVWLTFGTGSDGAGTITGIQFTRLQFAVGANPSGAAVNCNLSTGTGWFSLPFFGNTSNHVLILSLERTRDNNGALQNEWALYFKDSLVGAGVVIFNSTRQYPLQNFTVQQASANDTYDTEVGLGIQLPASKGIHAPLTNIYGVNNSTSETSKVGASQSIVTYASRDYIVNSRQGGLSTHTFAGGTAHFLTRFQTSNGDTN